MQATALLEIMADCDPFITFPIPFGWQDAIQIK
jgi:hypothetical protein